MSWFYLQVINSGIVQNCPAFVRYLGELCLVMRKSDFMHCEKQMTALIRAGLADRSLFAAYTIPKDGNFLYSTAFDHI